MAEQQICTWCSGTIRDHACTNCGTPVEHRDELVEPTPEPPAAEPAKIQDGLRELIRLAGEDPGAAHLAEAPSRAVYELLGIVTGYRSDPAAILADLEPVRGQSVAIASGDVDALCSVCLTPWSARVRAGASLDERSGDITGQALGELIAALGARITSPGMIAQQIAAVLVDSGRARSANVSVRTTHHCAHQRAESREGSSALVVIRREAEDGSTLSPDG